MIDVLRDLSDAELHEFIKNWEKLKFVEISIVCVEMLRRSIECEGWVEKQNKSKEEVSDKSLVDFLVSLRKLATANIDYLREMELGDYEMDEKYLDELKKIAYLINCFGFEEQFLISRSM